MENPALEDEIALLEAMYPEELHFNTKTQEVIYTSSSQAIVKLRISNSYPDSEAVPELVSATGRPPQKLDLRNQYRHALEEAHFVPGEPALDSMITIFNELLELSAHDQIPGSLDTPNAAEEEAPNQNGSPFRTVIIWLHHLLATSKRKQALDPPRSGSSNSRGRVSGLTKPGYPGLMIFSGPAAEVDEHVRGLKGLNWQAFQVRYEEAEVWAFAHGEGMKEVETMGEVVEEIGEDRKDAFMEAMRMR